MFSLWIVEPAPFVEISDRAPDVEKKRQNAFVGTAFVNVVNANLWIKDSPEMFMNSSGEVYVFSVEENILIKYPGFSQTSVSQAASCS